MTLYRCTDCFTVYDWPNEDDETIENWCFSAPCHGEDKREMERVDIQLALWRG